MRKYVKTFESFERSLNESVTADQIYAACDAAVQMQDYSQGEVTSHEGVITAKGTILMISTKVGWLWNTSKMVDGDMRQAQESCRTWLTNWKQKLTKEQRENNIMIPVRNVTAEDAGDPVRYVLHAAEQYKGETDGLFFGLSDELNDIAQNMDDYNNMGA